MTMITEWATKKSFHGAILFYLLEHYYEFYNRSYDIWRSKKIAVTSVLTASVVNALLTGNGPIADLTGNVSDVGGAYVEMKEDKEKFRESEEVHSAIKNEPSYSEHGDIEESTEVETTVEVEYDYYYGASQ